MIIIATHQDFNYKDIYKNAVIVDGGECKNKYSIPVLHETDRPSHYTDLHDTYAEMSRLHHMYCAKTWHYEPYMGFCQYKRMFKVKEEDITSIIKEHGIILPSIRKQSPTIAKAFQFYHRNNLLDEALDDVKRIFPSYAPEVDYMINAKDGELYPHNTFIMDMRHFRDYCYFMFRIFEELDKQHRWNTLDDWKKSGMPMKNHALMAERLSNVFYRHWFKKPHICGFV